MPVEKRIWKHFNSAKLKKDRGMLIIRAIIKYGKEVFTWKVLENCNSLKELNLRECELIKKHNPRYNIAIGGENGGGHSTSTKLKLSNIQKKKILCVDDQICFFSVLDAEAFYKAGKGTIGRVAAGRRNSYRNKKFEFINTSLKGQKSRD
jgi:group I intron endonuclease